MRGKYWALLCNYNYVKMTNDFKTRVFNSNSKTFQSKDK